MTTIRSATESASSWSCVTMIVVTPSFLCSERISWRRRTRSSASSAESGSSSSSRPGEVASARASAMRCCWPPESCAGNFDPLPGRPTSFSSSSTRAAAVAFRTFRLTKPYATFSATERFGNSAYDWKTMP